MTTQNKDLLFQADIPKEYLELEFQNWAKAPMTVMMLEKLRKQRQLYLDSAQNLAENLQNDLAIRTNLIKAKTIAEVLETLTKLK